MSATNSQARQAKDPRLAQRDSLHREVRRAYAREAARAAVVVCGDRGVARPPHSGLGCGSPTVLARLAPGERVLDLGSGAGFDCLAAAVEVGRKGLVVGIDMTPEMVRLARRHAADAGATTVHFVQGRIECLPFPDATFDVVISNCVMNLCAEKERALAEACRVLRQGGRLAVADIVALAPLPVAAGDLALHTGCIAGAVRSDEVREILDRAGFAAVAIDIAEHEGSPIGTWTSGTGLERLAAAANITATRPATRLPDDSSCRRST